MPLVLFPRIPSHFLLQNGMIWYQWYSMMHYCMRHALPAACRCSDRCCLALQLTWYFVEGGNHIWESQSFLRGIFPKPPVYVGSRRNHVAPAQQSSQAFRNFSGPSGRAGSRRTTVLPRRIVRDRSASNLRARIFAGCELKSLVV